MDLAAALIVNIALGVVAFTSILALAWWAIKTGEHGPPGWRRFRPGRPEAGVEAAAAG
jgi:hypothetical protein